MKLKYKDELNYSEWCGDARTSSEVSILMDGSEGWGMWKYLNGPTVSNLESAPASWVFQESPGNTPFTKRGRNSLVWGALDFSVAQ